MPFESGGQSPSNGGFEQRNTFQRRHMHATLFPQHLQSQTRQLHMHSSKHRSQLTLASCNLRLKSGAGALCRMQPHSSPQRKHPPAQLAIYDLLRLRLREADLAAAGLRLRLLAGGGEREAGVRLRLRPRGLSERALLRLRLRLQTENNASGPRE